MWSHQNNTESVNIVQDLSLAESVLFVLPLAATRFAMADNHIIYYKIQLPDVAMGSMGRGKNH
jgi:hypothetical protein